MIFDEMPCVYRKIVSPDGARALCRGDLVSFDLFPLGAQEVDLGDCEQCPARRDEPLEGEALARLAIVDPAEIEFAARDQTRIETKRAEGNQKPLLERAKTLGVAVVNFLADGAWITPEPFLSERRKTCETCPYRSGATCGRCGCLVSVKTAFPGERCPEGFWGAVKKPLWPSGKVDAEAKFHLRPRPAEIGGACVPCQQSNS